MSKFYGKTYRYEDKTIGVYHNPIRKIFMVGCFNPSTGKYQRMLSFMSKNRDELQRLLDRFAFINNLQEAQS